MAAPKKSKHWAITYAVCFGLPRNVRKVTIHYEDKGLHIGSELVKDIRDSCVRHAKFYVIGKGELHSIWTHFMVLLGLSLFMISPTFASNPCPSDSVYNFCITDRDAFEICTNNWCLSETEICTPNGTSYEVLWTVTFYKGNTLKKVFVTEDFCLQYYVDMIGREALRFNNKTLVFGPPWLTKQL